MAETYKSAYTGAQIDRAIGKALTEIDANAEDIEELNGDIEELNSDVAEARGSIGADAWSSSVTYGVNSYCIYNNQLWKCLVQHSSQMPSEGTYWTAVSVASELSILSTANDNTYGYYYNTNTDRKVLDNRKAAILYLLDSKGWSQTKFFRYMVRYSGGYYYVYEFFYSPSGYVIKEFNIHESPYMRLYLASYPSRDVDIRKEFS